MSQARSGAWLASVARGLARQGWWALPLSLLLTLLWVGNFLSPTWRELQALAIPDWQRTRCVPDGDSEWQPSALPQILWGDCWLLRTCVERSGLDLESAVLMLGGVHEDVSVIVNGTQVRSADPRGWHSRTSTAMWLPLASGLLQPGANELLLELRSVPGAHATISLYSAHIGPRHRMESFELRYRILQDGGAGAVLVLLLGMLLL